MTAINFNGKGKVPVGGGGGGTTDITAILDQVHKHANLPVLDQLTDSSDKLYYKGKELMSLSAGSYISANYVLETTDKKFVTGDMITALTGIKDNIQIQLNKFKFNGLKWEGRYNTYAQAMANVPTPTSGSILFVDNDETINNNKSIYIYEGTAWSRVRTDKQVNGWVSGTTAPTVTDVLWVDTTNISDVQIKYYNGIAWVSVSSKITSLMASQIVQETNLRFVSDAALALLAKMKEDPYTNGLVYNGTLLGSGGGGSSIDDSTANTSTTYSSTKIENLLLTKQGKLGYIPENIDNKGKINGYASLDTGGKVPLSQLPTLTAKGSQYVVFDLTAMNAITGMATGERCYITSLGKEYLYVSPNWILVSDNSMLGSVTKNNLTATINPTGADDTNSGYGIGSIWINTTTKRAFICTDATATKADWELMAGTTTLNVGEIIPFLYNANDPARTASQKDFEIPFIDTTKDFIEVTVDGLEKIKDVDYTIKQVATKFFVSFVSDIDSTSSVMGEIYRYDLSAAEENMRKADYDSDKDGKVDRAEVTDIAKAIQPFAQNTQYQQNDLILDNHSLYYSKANFLSGLTINPADWELVNATIKDLSKFTTADLADSVGKRYMTEAERTNIAKIPTIETNLTNLDTKVNTINSYIPSGTSPGNQLVNNNQLTTVSTNIGNRISALKFINLTDVNPVMADKGFLKVVSGKIDYVVDPRFPIKQITDSKNNTYNDIDNLAFSCLEMDTFTGGKLTLKPSIRTINLLDMPASIDQQGYLLMSNKDQLKYELVDPKTLTISQENFAATVLSTDWVYNSGTTKYEYTVTHNLDSENLVTEYTDTSKVQINNVTYKIVDSNNITLISPIAQTVKATINCSLGVLNGYWTSSIDYSKFNQIDDTLVRTDKSYSSSKVEYRLTQYAKLTDIYTKAQCDTRYATKASEHIHANMLIINGITENTSGNLTYKGKELLTQINPKHAEIYLNKEYTTLTTVIDTAEIMLTYGMTALANSEITIKNEAVRDLDETINASRAAHITVTDGTIVLLDIDILPQEVQKYQLGISSNIQVMVQGICNVKYYATAF